MTTSFPCTGCGCCCKRIDILKLGINISNDPSSDFYFPYSHDETGRCENLMEDNKCAVYETRPLVCNIEKYAERIGVDKREMYKMNARACNMFMNEDGVDISLRIDVLKI